MNEIHVISPYKYHGTWVFDDARVGLLQEPFVAGADTWIDRSFFPARLFPVTNTGSIGVAQKVGATGITRLTWTGGMAMSGSFSIFSDAPMSLYAQVKARA
jgi:hypothetical protein